MSARQRQQPNLVLGEKGESRAVAFLTSLHYQILDRNIRLGTREIDIVAVDPRTKELVFVEVKTRTSDAYGSPTAAVTKAKLRSLQTVARAYKRARHLYTDHRFDILAVLPKQIEHYVNISWNF